MEVIELCESCLVKYVQCIGMLEILRDHVRFVFNRTEGKLEVVVLKGSGSVRIIPKPLFSYLFDCNCANGVNIEIKSSSPPLHAI
jgi:hypothetical protein